MVIKHGKHSKEKNNQTRSAMFNDTGCYTTNVSHDTRSIINSTCCPYLMMYTNIPALPMNYPKNIIIFL